MTAYEQGFITKCAEFGIPSTIAGEMLKSAKSTLGHEIAGATISSAIPYIGSIPAAVGSMAGALNGRDLSDEEVEKLIEQRGNAGNYIPGVASYRAAQRSGQLAKKIVERAAEIHAGKVRPTRHMLTENLSILNPLNIVGGSLVGSIVGASKPHRTLDEQVAHDAKPQSWKNLLVPGYGAYQSALRLGASRDVMEKDKKEKENQGGKE